MAWDPEEALKKERELLDETPFDQTRRELTQALPLAANELIRLATDGETEKIRFDACRYIVERGLGPTAQQYLASQGKDAEPIEKMLAAVITEYETKGS